MFIQSFKNFFISPSLIRSGGRRIFYFSTKGALLAGNGDLSHSPIHDVIMFVPFAKIVAVVVRFYDALQHLRSLASLFTLSVKSPTNFAQRL